MYAPKTILVPTDFSQYSDQAMQIALSIAKQYKSKVYLLHVIDIIQQCSIDYCLSTEQLGQVKTQTLKKTEENLSREIERVKPDKIDIAPIIRQGSAYKEIIDAQQETKSDLIVIATHGRTGLLHHLMGCVTEKVSRGAKCSVLLVRT